MQRSAMYFAILVLIVSACRLAIADRAFSAERLVFRRDGEQHAITGKVLVTAEDGGKLLLAPDGALWAVEPDEMVRQETVAEPFRPLSADELEQELRAELPDGFEIHKTANYLICYNTTRPYAQWCGALFERLHRAFHNFWERRGFELETPSFPLVAVVFADRNSYEAYAKPELGDGVGSIIGYYSLRSNRITTYDLTGVQALRRPQQHRSSADTINQILSQPKASPLVATVIHEATHQIAFNCGLQTRYADVPLWLSEGIAMYFETPDLRSSKGWRGIGAVNRPRLYRFRRDLSKRDSESLVSLVSEDTRLRNPRTAASAYAEAWALTNYLIRRHPKEFVAYSKMLSEKGRLLWDKPEERLAEFQKHFGDIEELERNLVRQMRALR